MTTTTSRTGSKPELTNGSSGCESTADFRSPRNRRLGRENAQEKGMRLLVEGRLQVVKVDGDLIVARCKGDSGETYWLGHEPESSRPWRCTCPAKTACSHLSALWRVVSLESQ